MLAEGRVVNFTSQGEKKRRGVVIGSGLDYNITKQGAIVQFTVFFVELEGGKVVAALPESCTFEQHNDTLGLSPDEKRRSRVYDSRFTRIP